jgi:hypothetical protein
VVTGFVLLPVALPRPQPPPAVPRLQFDKAAADALDLKAGYDKMVVDAVEHRAQVGAPVPS